MAITDADLQALFAQNPMAAEQLRRIIAERQRDEALAQLAEAGTATTTNNKNDSNLTVVGAE